MFESKTRREKGGEGGAGPNLMRRLLFWWGRRDLLFWWDPQPNLEINGPRQVTGWSMDKKKKRDGPRFVIRPSILIDQTAFFKGLFLEGIEKMREEEILFWWKINDLKQVTGWSMDKKRRRGPGVWSEYQWVIEWGGEGCDGGGKIIILTNYLKCRWVFEKKGCEFVKAFSHKIDIKLT